MGGLWSFTLLLYFKSVYKAVIHKRIWTIEILTNEHEINREDLIGMVENLVFNYVLLWLINIGKKVPELTWMISYTDLKKRLKQKIKV